MPRRVVGLVVARVAVVRALDAAGTGDDAERDVVRGERRAAAGGVDERRAQQRGVLTIEEERGAGARRRVRRVDGEGEPDRRADWR